MFRKRSLVLHILIVFTLLMQVRADTQYTDPLLAEYAYDQGTNGTGRRTSMTAYAVDGGASAFQNMTTWTYDERGRVKTETHNFGPGSDYLFTYTYTEGDLLQQIRYPMNEQGQSGEQVTTKYWWPARLPKGLVGASWYVGTSTLPGAYYNEMGQMTWLRFGNNMVTGYAYDDAYRVESIENGDQSIERQNLAYHYDAVGNITKIIDSAILNDEETLEFNYDNMTSPTRSPISVLALRPSINISGMMPTAI